MKEFTYEDFDKILELFKTDKSFTDIKYTDDGMVILSGKDLGWIMMNATEFDRILDEKIREWLTKL